MKLSELSPANGAKRSRKRLGRGNGSGHGTTAGRGTKGYNSRSGGGVRPGYEGGQMPIQRRLPKRGFTNLFKKRIAVVNVKDLQRVFASGDTVDETTLKQRGLVKGKYDGVKLLGKGDIGFPVTLRLSDVSRGAREKITAAGGTIESVTA